MPDILNQYDYKRFERLLETMIGDQTQLIAEHRILGNSEAYVENAKNAKAIFTTLKLLKERQNLIKA